MSITLPPKNYSVLFLDMNSFFATVEQQVRPELRGQPVGVSPYTGDTGCVIAASREAKERGVKIARVGEAKKLCPQIKILEARPALYMIYHKEIKKVLESFSPWVKPLSVDEFLIRLSPRERNYAESTTLAKAIKQKIKIEVGDYLTCSVGIGPSYFLAKVAGERKKPDGLTVVRLEQLESFYGALRLMDLPGINTRLARRLYESRINSPLDLYHADLTQLRGILNHWGRLWYYRLRGYEIDEYEIKSKTVGHSHVLAPEFRTEEGARSVIKKLIHKAGYRLRKEGYCANGVAVMVRFLDRGGLTLSHRTEPFSDDMTFAAHIETLLRQCQWVSRPIYVSVTAFSLTKKAGAPISIFKEIERLKQVAETIDRINDRFGADTIYPASIAGTEHTAPDRIPFGKPRYDIRHTS